MAQMESVAMTALRHQWLPSRVKIMPMGGQLVSVRMCPPSPPRLEGLVGFRSYQICQFSYIAFTGYSGTGSRGLPGLLSSFLEVLNFLQVFYFWSLVCAELCNGSDVTTKGTDDGLLAGAETGLPSLELKSDSTF